MAANMRQPETIDQEPVKVDMEGAVAIANTPNDEPSPPICKMDIDCCEEVFDYLPLKDLRAVGQTCKRMNAVAVHIFKESHPGVVARLTDGTIKTTDGVQLHGYTRVMQSISVIDGRMCDFDYIAMNKFGLLKHIEFWYTDLSRIHIDRIKKILGQIESLHLVVCRFSGDLFEDMLKFCVNLKRLDVLSKSFKNVGIIIGNGNDWLKEKYSKLEQFKLYLGSTHPVYELPTFFAQNRGIRKFVMDQHTLQANRASIMASGLKLDCLEIILAHQGIPFDQLNNLHAEGLYQRLEIIDVNRNDIKQMKSLHGLGKVQSIECYDYYDDFNFADLVNLKEVKFRCFIRFSIKALIKQLVNLERIHFDLTFGSNIRDLIYYSVNLKAIRAEALFGGDVDNGYGLRNSEKFNCDAILGLPKWNTERAKLNKARKVKIFVNEKVYLKTKWALKATDFGLIEIKRLAADL